MFTGIDIGGTNTDIAVIDSVIHTYKIPNRSGFKEALKIVPASQRLAISTSQPLNEILTGSPVDIRSITIPGPGLIYPGAVKGAVSHRGEIVEPIDRDEILNLIRNCHADKIVIVGKFSVRNSSLEDEVHTIVSDFFSDEHVATSSHLGVLNFPARIRTTEMNVRIKAHVAALIRQISAVHNNFLFVTSRGGLCGPDQVYLNPSLLFHSSPATVATGAYYLSREEDALVIDIGGTTTDLIRISGGKPVYETVVFEGKKTLIQAIEAKNIPYGGDSAIRDELCRFRTGAPRSFGGGEPTLTDALNVLGARIGDEKRSQGLDPKKAHEVVQGYLETVASAVREYHPKILIGTGYLAHYLLPEITERAQTPGTVPEHAASANAVGAAVSRVSLDFHVHADSEQKRLIINGKDHEYRGSFDDESLIRYMHTFARNSAVSEGAPEDDVNDLIMHSFTAYNVVRGWRVTARISDFVLGIAPGISMEAP